MDILLKGTNMSIIPLRFERELLKGVAPTLVMELLTRQAMYGYELSQALAKRSNGIFNLILLLITNSSNR